jgi:membrane peptidoglycan carboxypeptidase
VSQRRQRAGIRDEAAAGRRGPDKRFGLGRRTRRGILIGLAVIGAAVLALAGVVAYAALTLPNIDDIGKVTGTIRILDRHGTLIAEVGHNAERRTTVALDEIAPIMQKATLAAEDRNFYNEGAFDFRRVVKAVIDDVILRRPAEGASTITQQLVKQAFFGQQASKDPLRKIREALLAQEIEGKWSKDKILDEYLNITYYGENAYGVETAAERYFGKHAKDLTLGEAALLAGLPEAPSYNDPYSNPTAAYARMHYVLTGLVGMGAVTQAEAEQVDPLVGGDRPDAAEAAAQTQIRQGIEADLLNGKQEVNPAPHFVQYVEDQLQSEFSDDPSYLNASLVVTTTLDLGIQAKAQHDVQAGVARIGHNANNGALLMLDARTGQILAMVGSADYADDSIAGQFNVTLNPRQPGSSFKPYVYEEGFRSGALTPSTILQDTQQESRQLNNVPDFDGRYLGPITAARALLLSRNIATEQAMEIAGVENVIAFAHSLGITSPLAPDASTAIGSSAVRMIDHASAYAAFANGGHKVTAYGILRVVDDKGNVLADHTQPAGEGDPMTPAQAWEITKILRGYAHYWGLPIRWDTAGKSGTTTNFVDAWYMAYTPDWVVASWAGHTSGTNPAEVGMDEVFGVTMAQYITVPFINSLPKPAAFTPVNGVTTDCSAQDRTVVNQSGCPTATPTPSSTTGPSVSATPSATPFPSPPTVCPSPTPSVGVTPLLTPTPTLSPCP